MACKVPYIKQFNRSACVAACFEMVFASYGVRINQRAIYKKAEPTTKGIPYGNLMLAIKDKNYVLERWTNHKSPEDKGTKKAKQLGLIKLHKNANIKLLKSFLKKGIFAIIGVDADTWYKDYKNWKAPTGDTHAIVVSEYNTRTNKFIVNDPFLPYLKRNGKCLEVSSNHLKAAWDKCDNSMSVLRPKGSSIT